MDQEYVINPLTGRKIIRGGKTYQKLLKQMEEEAQASDGKESTETKTDTTPSSNVDQDICMEIEQSQESVVSALRHRTNMQEVAADIMKNHYEALLAAYHDPSVSFPEFIDTFLSQVAG